MVMMWILDYLCLFLLGDRAGTQNPWTLLRNADVVATISICPDGSKVRNFPVTSPFHGLRPHLLRSTSVGKLW